VKAYVQEQLKAEMLKAIEEMETKMNTEMEAKMQKAREEMKAELQEDLRNADLQRKQVVVDLRESKKKRGGYESLQDMEGDLVALTEKMKK
jgi:predicted secreted Zn-dependent protease